MFPLLKSVVVLPLLWFLTLHAPSYLQVIPQGLACQSGLRVGDRILEVNAIDLRHATHQEAVRALLANKQEIRMLVRTGSFTAWDGGDHHPETAWGEARHQYSWRGQGSRWKPLWPHGWGNLHLKGKVLTIFEAAGAQSSSSVPGLNCLSLVDVQTGELKWSSSQRCPAAGWHADPGGEQPQPAGDDAHGGSAGAACCGRLSVHAGVWRVRPKQSGSCGGEKLKLCLKIFRLPQKSKIQWLMTFKRLEPGSIWCFITTFTVKMKNKFFKVAHCFKNYFLFAGVSWHHCKPVCNRHSAQEQYGKHLFYRPRSEPRGNGDHAEGTVQFTYCFIHSQFILTDYRCFVINIRPDTRTHSTIWYHQNTIHVDGWVKCLVQRHCASTAVWC